MNPEIQKELLGWLQGLRQAVESGAAFAKQQIPQILWEKIILDRVYYTVLIAVAIILMVSFAYLFRKRMTLLDEYDSKHDSTQFGTLLAVTITHAAGAVIGFFVVLANWYDLMMVWFAPRLYLIQWIKELIKPSGT